MPNNPYNPPKTHVADPPLSDRGPLPVSIKSALVLVVFFALVECYHVFARMPLVNNGEISGAAWLAEWMWVGAIVVAGIFIARGRGWARWILLAMLLYQLYQLADALLFLSFVEPGSVNLFVDPISLLMLPLSTLFSLGAVILVFGPGRSWFRPR